MNQTCAVTMRDHDPGGGHDDAASLLSLDMQGVSRSIRRYLTSTMPESTKVTGGNVHIIMFLAKSEGSDVFQHDIERRFSITRSTASRVLSLMERKGLIVRTSVAADARLKRITLTDAANAIVAELRENAQRMERQLMAGFSEREERQLAEYLKRLRNNVDMAQRSFDAASGSDSATTAYQANTNKEDQ
ncbi:MarR family winged helix-turn-helix transcriptional regulator [Bifidobacterium mongoliense]|uniref:MarR family winged helix-turn-helix transcriptional regulator n=1 Tax=Bifidobacterium mongoliense TaxID=518643 RepID=UPI002649B28B|nr:MarR family transcriptional regulator [Bifidobacterium mongoliense]MDN5979386.1 MarR family transcriptional regulator [Bifidobacterium mongoliense]MDN6025409.1 MarR family transcriptional regulator [Bifidobacterium mongoliense]MDN6050628.1 MarR family transcriptional regulator [Bifidobacterium mongoliense]MDN6485295.1 MarR family transcriptional regulator [Bifidobacterium mongoliense]MDN6554442.1 MarR family transcriptional regulator [Bifidobacterium mongoliense]